MRINLQACLFLALALGACASSERGIASTAQAIAGPGGVTATPPTVDGVPVAGELTVTWTADPLAFKYYVFQSASGQPYAYLTSVVDPSGQPPAPTTYTAASLTGGAQYCYAIQAAYLDSTMSDIGAPGCGTAAGNGTGAVRTIAIPVVGPTIGPATLTAIVQGNGAVLEPLYLSLPSEVGSTIRAVRARVNDGGNGNLAEVALLSTSDAGHSLAIVATSPTSDGGGTDQTVEAGGLDVAVTPATQYYLEVLNASGPLNAITEVFRAEFDVN